MTAAKANQTVVELNRSLQVAGKEVTNSIRPANGCFTEPNRWMQDG